MAPITLKNEAAPNTLYYTPSQTPPAGTALSDKAKNVSNIFKPIKIRSVTFQNRIFVAPMCMFSADQGHLTDFHLMHLGSMAFRGAGLTFIEATSVLPNGRIAPEDAGLWTDSQIAPIKRIVDFVHSQGQKIGIQLAHAGRKASTLAPWLVKRGQKSLATKDAGGWEDDIMGPSAIRWSTGHGMPREMSARDIQDVIDAFRDSTVRALQAGVDVIEIHAAHGYLLSSFLSPISNQRLDKYGGSFENRSRLLVEVIQAIRGVIPSGMPLMVRISATEWMEESTDVSWDVEQSIQLAKILPALGVDLLDVSSGGNNEKQKISAFNGFQIGIAGKIREELHKAGVKDLLIGAVGSITEAEDARDILEEGKSQGGASTALDDRAIKFEDEHGILARADVVLVGRQFLREPEWVLKTAAALGIPVKLPNQYGYAPYRRPQSKI